MRGMNNKSSKKLIAVKLTGAYHKANGLSCQDFFDYKRKGNKIIAVVSDGAGSAKYGHIGARIICQTLCDILISSTYDNIRQKIIDAVDVARQKLMMHRLNKTKKEQGLIDFAATLVGVIYINGKGLFFHIGDGAGIALMDDKKHKSAATNNALHFKKQPCSIISEPENGIFSCETYFYTMDDWKDSLRFTPFEKAKTLILMTDGVTNFALKKNAEKTELESGFVEPINHFLLQETNPKRAARALKNTLSTPRAVKLNPDDKTFLWAEVK